MQCITRVATIIMNLLSLAQDKSVPAADDFMPVLVFVSTSIILDIPVFTIMNSSFPIMWLEHYRSLLT